MILIPKGEDFISIPTGIAVQVVTIAGAAMFVVFSDVFDSATQQTEDSVDSIVTNG